MSDDYYFKDRFINDITVDDGRVRVIGRIIDSGQGYFLLDDGRGKIFVFENTSYKIGDLVQVVGKVIVKNNELGLQPEIIKPITKINLQLYSLLLEIKKKFF